MSVKLEDLRRLAAEVVAEEMEEAAKAKKAGKIPGPVIGFLMKKGIISKKFKGKGGKKKGKVLGKDKESKFSRVMRGRRKESMKGMVRYRRR